MTSSTSTGRIVVGIDGSEHSEAALRWALRQAVATGSTVQAVACWEWPPAAAVAAGYVDLAAETREAAQAEVAKAVADLGLQELVHVQTQVVEGLPGHVLVEAARGADLLVVGSRGRGTIGRALLGSVSTHCAGAAPCPVVVVREPRAEAV